MAGDYFCAVAGVGVCGAADWVNRFLMALALKPSPMMASDAGMISSFWSCSRAPDKSPARATPKAMPNRMISAQKRDRSVVGGV